MPQMIRLMAPDYDRRSGWSAAANNDRLRMSQAEADLLLNESSSTLPVSPDRRVQGGVASPRQRLTGNSVFQRAERAESATVSGTAVVASTAAAGGAASGGAAWGDGGDLPEREVMQAMGLARGMGKTSTREQQELVEQREARARVRAGVAGSADAEQAADSDGSPFRVQRLRAEQQRRDGHLEHLLAQAAEGHPQQQQQQPGEGSRRGLSHWTNQL